MLEAEPASGPRRRVPADGGASGGSGSDSDALQRVLQNPPNQMTMDFCVVGRRRPN